MALKGRFGNRATPGWLENAFFFRPDDAKLILKQRFSCPDRDKLALEWQLGRPNGTKFIEKMGEGGSAKFLAPTKDAKMPDFFSFKVPSREYYCFTEAHVTPEIFSLLVQTASQMKALILQCQVDALRTDKVVPKYAFDIWLNDLLASRNMALVPPSNDELDHRDRAIGLASVAEVRLLEIFPTSMPSFEAILHWTETFLLGEYAYKDVPCHALKQIVEHFVQLRRNMGPTVPPEDENGASSSSAQSK